MGVRPQFCRLDERPFYAQFEADLSPIFLCLLKKGRKLGSDPNSVEGA
jgi:hypothetical protein